MSEILLSICIPTYNRSCYLEKLLSSIVTQNVSYGFEVIIRDNASDDDTGHTARSFCESNANFIYIRNEKNNGGIINIRQCTEGARGKFILLIGDDDVFVEDAFLIIKECIDAIGKNNVSAVLFNKHLSTDFNVAKLFDNGFEWLRTIKVNEPAFLPAVLWRRQFWEEFDYYENIKLFYLPQLHCFINASHLTETYGCNRELVLKGVEIDTGDKSYWFYRFHALVDCFEYPYLYRDILNDKKIDLKTRAAILIKETKLLKEIVKKIAFIKANQDDYLKEIPGFQSIYKGKFYSPFLSFYLKVIFHSRYGAKLAQMINK